MCSTHSAPQSGRLTGDGGEGGGHLGGPVSLARFFGRGGGVDTEMSAPDDGLESVAGLLFTLAPETSDCFARERCFCCEPGAGVLGAGQRCGASNGSLLAGRRAGRFGNEAVSQSQWAPEPFESVRPFFFAEEFEASKSSGLELAFAGEPCAGELSAGVPGGGVPHVGQANTVASCPCAAACLPVASCLVWQGLPWRACASS